MGEAGAEVVGVDWRVPLAEASRRIGPAYAVQGNLDPALLSAPWPVLAERVREVIRSGAAAPGPHLQPRPRRTARHRSGGAGPDRRPGAHRGRGAAGCAAERLAPAMTHVAVVGGGITGLAAARLLVRRGHRGHRAGAGPGDGAASWRPLGLDGVRLDGGAESMLARRPEAVDLIDDLGLGDRLVHPTGAKPALLVGGASHPLPPSLLGVPTDARGAARTAVCRQGYRVAAGEAGPPGRRSLIDDVAIGDVRRRAVRRRR